MADETAPTLEESISEANVAAAAEDQKGEVENVEDTKTKTEKHAKVDSKKESESTEKEESSEDDGLTDDERKQALDLYKALKNPASQKFIVQELAKSANIKIDETSTKEEVKEVKKTISDVLKEELGDELEFLSPKMAAALEKIIPAMVDKQVEDLRKANADSKEAELNKQIDTAHAELTEEFSDYANYEQEMLKLMDTVHPAPGLSPKKYFTNLYYIAKGSGSPKEKVDTSKETIQKNRGNAAERLSSERKGKSADVVETPSKMDLASAIKKAQEELEKDKDK